MQQTNSQQLINSAIEHANHINIAVSVAIFDSGSNLVAFQKMDDAPIGSIDVALKKAKTAVLFRAPTELLGTKVREQQLDSIEQTNNGLILFPGGEPIKLDYFVGGIGVSGGTAAQDKEVALYAIAHLNSLNKI